MSNLYCSKCSQKALDDYDKIPFEPNEYMRITKGILKYFGNGQLLCDKCNTFLNPADSATHVSLLSTDSVDDRDHLFYFNKGQYSVEVLPKQNRPSESKVRHDSLPPPIFDQLANATGVIPINLDHPKYIRIKKAKKADEFFEDAANVLTRVVNDKDHL
jgi:hypothetical protein